MHREAKWPTTSSPVTPTWSSSRTTRPILGVVADKPDLFCSQPDVQGVQHRTHRRDGAIGFDISWLFHMNVATLLSALTPTSRSALASCAVRARLRRMLPPGRCHPAVASEPDDPRAHWFRAARSHQRSADCCIVLFTCWAFPPRLPSRRRSTPLSWCPCCSTGPAAALSSAVRSGRSTLPHNACRRRSHQFDPLRLQAAPARSSR